MRNVGIEIPQGVYDELWRHLLPSQQGDEEAAFAFVRPLEGQASTFGLVEWYPIQPGGFEYQSAFHLELADAERARIIKMAHDLNASIVEFHSHVSSHRPSFSGSDLLGFEETVPHVMWRLKGKPYFAVVVSRSGFDGLAWISDPNTAIQLDWIRVGKKVFRSTGKTLNNYE